MNNLIVKYFKGKACEKLACVPNLHNFLQTEFIYYRIVAARTT